MKRVKVGSIVELENINTEKKYLFCIVDQSRETHYLNSDFYRGHYYFKQEQVLKSGGDGISSISLASPIGKAINGKTAGDVVKYKDNTGEIQSITIISIDGEEPDDD